MLTSLFRERGVHLDKTMQLNVGGNSDFLNMLERERLESKKISKTNAVTSMLDYDIGEGNVHVGPSDYVPWLTDRKWAYIRMEGSSFGDVPLNVELKLEVWDSPNSAGIVIDAVRLAKLALNNGVAGALEGPSAYLMKSPPKQIVDDEAYESVRGLHRAEQAQEGQGEGREELARCRSAASSSWVRRLWSRSRRWSRSATVLNGELRRDRGEDLRHARDDVRRGLDRDRRPRLPRPARARARSASPGIVLACAGFVLWSAQIWGGYDSDGYWKLIGARHRLGARAARRDHGAPDDELAAARCARSTPRRPARRPAPRSSRA